MKQYCLGIALVFIIVDYLWSQTSCDVTYNCATCDTTTGTCSLCPKGKGWQEGQCLTIDSPKHCLFFNNPNNSTLNSTSCALCEEGYYLKYSYSTALNEEQCEAGSAIAKCHDSCYGCRELATDSLQTNSGDGVGSECMVCEPNYYYDSTASDAPYACQLGSDPNGWTNCDY